MMLDEGLIIFAINLYVCPVTDGFFKSLILNVIVFGLAFAFANAPFMVKTLFFISPL